MGIPVKMLLFTLLAVMPVLAEENPDMDFFLFIADFTDEQGNWDAPEIDDEPVSAEADGEEK